MEKHAQNYEIIYENINEIKCKNYINDFFTKINKIFYRKLKLQIDTNVLGYGVFKKVMEASFKIGPFIYAF